MQLNIKKLIKRFFYTCLFHRVISHIFTPIMFILSYSLFFFNCICYLSSISHIARLLTTFLLIYFILFIISSYLFHPFIFNRCLLFSIFLLILQYHFPYSHVFFSYSCCISSLFFPLYWSAHHPTQFILDRTLVRYFDIPLFS